MTSPELDGSTERRVLVTTSFEIEGDPLDIEACTQAVGLPPTRFSERPRQTGTSQPSGTPYAPTPFWSLEFGKEPADTIDDGLARILALLWDRRNEIRRFVETRELTASFTSTVSIYQDRPALELSAKTLERLAFFKVDYGLDVLDYTS
jgi:hypothetical protein